MITCNLFSVVRSIHYEDAKVRMVAKNVPAVIFSRLFCMKTPLKGQDFPEEADKYGKRHYKAGDRGPFPGSQAV